MINGGASHLVCGQLSPRWIQPPAARLSDRATAKEVRKGLAQLASRNSALRAFGNGSSLVVASQPVTLRSCVRSAAAIPEARWKEAARIGPALRRRQRSRRSIGLAIPAWPDRMRRRRFARRGTGWTRIAAPPSAAARGRRIDAVARLATPAVGRRAGIATEAVLKGMRRRQGLL